MESLISHHTARADPSATSQFDTPQPAMPQLAMLDFFFPGFSVLSSALYKYLGVDLNVYIPLVLLFGGLMFAWRYFSDYAWNLTETHLMSSVDIRTDDEIYNAVMSWVAAQRFAQGARRFVVNTNTNSRSWFLWRWEDDEDEDDTGEGLGSQPTKKPLSYSPSFGSHMFWYKRRLLMFNRTQNREQATFMVVSEREEISISCFGRNPGILKELLLDARQVYMKKDEAKTLIYRGTTKSGSTEPNWQRCMSRTSRPFSTVILNEKVKSDLIDDVTDYLNPATRRWYSNRGIPYRRGYLLYGPPGTGKSSLSLALAGFFKMRIYIVSLSSVTASEENLATLFAELPRRCVVLLEDIDTAGLTHTRDENKTAPDASSDDMVAGQVTPGNGSGSPSSGRLSLSGLLNILDGVASQEGRVLIMTTNHLEKLDKALIRPGRVDMIVKFDLADQDMTTAIFRAIFATLEGDEASTADDLVNKVMPLSPEEEKAIAAKEAKKRADADARVEALARQFASKIPAHEFSPAEIQGYLLKNKRNPEAVVSGAESWVEETRKEKKAKELEEAEKKRKEEAERKKKEEEEAKKKKEEEEAKKKEEEEAKKKDEAKKESGDGAQVKEETQEKAKEKTGEESGEKKAEGPKVEGPKVDESSDEKTKEAPEAVKETKTVESKLAVEDEKHERDSGYGTP
jgi:mitochondrial chaperone BCS1